MTVNCLFVLGYWPVSVSDLQWGSGELGVCVSAIPPAAIFSKDSKVGKRIEH